MTNLKDLKNIKENNVETVEEAFMNIRADMNVLVDILAKDGLIEKKKMLIKK